MPRHLDRLGIGGDDAQAAGLCGAHYGSAASLVALVLLAYANALGGTFQFDDFNVIVDLDSVHSLQDWWADAGQGIRPLLKLSYALNWISAAGAAGFIAVNILIHAGMVLLVLCLSQAFLRAQGLEKSLPHVPWLAAALFALHPAQTEAVTYICGRSTSLMALLYLAGLLAHARIGNGSWRQQCLPPLCFVLALGVKETAVTFPLALCLWDVWTGKPLASALRRAWPTWLLFALACAGFAANDAYRAAMERSLAFNSLAGNVATQLDACLYLARQWVAPLWLNIDPDLPVQEDFSQALPALAFLLVVLAVMAWSGRKRPWLGFGLAWALLQWLPLYLFLPRLDVANDRQLYLAIWPLGLALSVEMQRALPPRMAHALLAACLLVTALLSIQRNQDYHSEVALWEQTARLSPSKSRVHNNLGYAYGRVGRPVEARQEYLRALWLDPGNIKARMNLRRLNADRAAAAAP